MNFLKIVQTAVIESGVHDTGPTSVVGQTGMFAKFVQWVQQEWDDIQTACPAWDWMNVSTSFTTSANKESYTGTELGLSVRDWDLSHARVYLSSDGVAGQMFLNEIPFDEWRRCYDFGTKATGFPSVITRDYETLYLYAVPDNEYVVSVDYFKENQSLAANTDVPEMPSRFHRLLVDGALIRFAMVHDAPEIATSSTIRKRQMMGWLWRDQGPKVGLVVEGLL